MKTKETAALKELNKLDTLKLLYEVAMTAISAGLVIYLLIVFNVF